MPRRPARVTQADIARAIRAVAQTGARMAVEIDAEGTIRIVPTAEAPERAGKVQERDLEPKREIML